MIELLGVTLEKEVYAALVRLEVDSTFYQVRFGIQVPDNTHLKRILAFRPFEHTGVAPYRYFFALGYSYDPTDEPCPNHCFESSN